MASLFISYSRKDIDAARMLTSALKERELDFWIDWEGIPPTVDWWQEIQKGIEDADIFLFLLSPDSCKSKICRQEIEHAAINGKRLIPLVVKDIRADESPVEFRKINWILMRGEDDFHAAFGKLITAIQTDYAWAQTHRQLQVKALEWERGNHENSFLLRGKELQDAEYQLTINTSKEPHPTDLQREYVYRSRQATDRQRRITSIIAAVTAVLMAGLAFYAVVQARLADERATVARAGELAAQSVSLRGTQFDLSLLLSIEAVLTHASPQTESALLDNTQTHPQLLQYLFSHSGPVPALAFHPDGKIFASGSEDHTIILWDASTRQPIGQPLTDHTGFVYSLAFSPDGRTLASGSEDHTVILWDVETGQPIGEPLSGHAASVNSVAYSPDGKILASGGEEGTIILWDVATRQPIGQPLFTQGEPINSIAFSPDGKTLASGSEDYEIILWNVETGRPLGDPLSAHAGRVNSVAFSPDGKILASGSEDGTIILWDREAWRPMGEPLSGHAGRVNSVAFSPDGKTLASGSNDGTILVWNTETGQPVGQPLTGHASFVLRVAFSPDGKTLASGSDDHTVILWDLETHQPLGEPIAGDTGIAFSVAFSPDGKTLASGISGGLDDTIILWDVVTRKPIGEPLTGHTGFIESVAFSPDGKTLASGSADSTIIIWDVETGRPSGEPLTGHALPGLIESVAFSPDGKILASGSWDHTIILWDLETRQPIGEPLSGHTDTVKSVAFSPDGKSLASGSNDGTIILWDVSGHRSIGEALTGHTSLVLSVAFSPDSKTLASGSYDGTIILWDVETRKPIGQPLTGNTGGVTTVAFGPDGKILASGNDDGTITLWGVETRQSIGRPLTGHTGSVESVTFSPDGKTLASGSFEIILWEVSPQHWIEQSCQRVSRNYTLEEWERYFQNETYRKTCERLPKHSSYYQALAEQTISESTDDQRFQRALLRVRSEMEMDSSIEDSVVMSSRIVEEIVARKISNEINTGRWQEALDLLEQAEGNNLSLDPVLDDENILNKLCWGGSAQGFASQVLKYCVQAVKLVPNDPNVRDSRGLARALLGDYAGAMEDFQFFVENSDSDMEFEIQERQRWIADLRAGKNPFTAEVLEVLREQ